MKKINLIIDTDPGVDDSIAIIPTLFDKNINILLFTTVSGNVNVDLCTKNILHILEYYKKNIPVAKGAAKPLSREPKDATFIHGSHGTGKYTIQNNPKIKPIRKSAVEAMYEQICAHKGDVSIALLAPHTNMAKLLLKHPDVKNMINEIVMMGTSAYGVKKITPYVNETHVSFNSSSDPEALKIVLESGIPIVIVPSEIGRAAYLTEKEVLKVKENKIAGNMMFNMLNGYWEPNVSEKITAMNDSCALLFLRDRKIFKTESADVEIDIENEPGKTTYTFKPNGKIKIVTNLKLKKFHRYFFKSLKNIK